MGELPQTNGAERTHLLASVVWVLTAVLILGVVLAACSWLGTGGVEQNVFSNISNGLAQ
jgi:hypothetical protein